MSVAVGLLSLIAACVACGWVGWQLGYRKGQRSVIRSVRGGVMETKATEVPIFEIDATCPQCGGAVGVPQTIVVSPGVAVSGTWRQS